jgi:anti-sigma-K factor RskA
MNLRDPEERAGLAGEYVLGTLAPDERAAFERELRNDAELARAVYEWQDRLVGLAATVKEVAPTPDLWTRIARDLATPPTARAKEEAPSWWSNLFFWRFAALFATTAAVVLGWLTFVAEPRDTGFRYTAVLQAPDKTPGWLVEADARKQVRLTPLVQTQVEPGRALQFWTKPEGAAGPTSLGLVPADRATIVPASRLPGLGENQLFEITLEPAQGSPIGKPTGPVLFIGRAVATPS